MDSSLLVRIRALYQILVFVLVDCHCSEYRVTTNSILDSAAGETRLEECIKYEYNIGPTVTEVEQNRLGDALCSSAFAFAITMPDLAPHAIAVFLPLVFSWSPPLCIQVEH